jgi:hypothetical protein
LQLRNQKSTAKSKIEEQARIIEPSTKHQSTNNKKIVTTTRAIGPNPSTQAQKSRTPSFLSDSTGTRYLILIQ